MSSFTKRQVDVLHERMLNKGVPAKAMKTILSKFSMTKVLALFALAMEDGPKVWDIASEITTQISSGTKIDSTFIANLVIQFGPTLEEAIDHVISILNPTPAPAPA